MRPLVWGGALVLAFQLGCTSPAMHGPLPRLTPRPVGQTTIVGAMVQYAWMRQVVTGELVALAVCPAAAHHFPDSTLRALVGGSSGLIQSAKRLEDCRDHAAGAPEPDSVARVTILAISPDPLDPSVGLVRASSVSRDGIGVIEIARFALPVWRARSIEFLGFEQAQPPPPEFRGASGQSSPSSFGAVVACGDGESRLGSSLLDYLRAMLTRPRFHYLAPKFGLNVADSGSIRMITDPAECERAAQAFIRARQATLPRMVYVVAIGEARWVEDPNTKAGEYIAGVVFTATYDSVLALPGR